jgi:hypothetical protein
METQIEVIEPRLAKAEARPIMRSAQRHWRTARRATLLLCTELRRLQEGEAHITYGYKNFGQFAVEHITPELTEGVVQKFSWQGAPLLALERHGRLVLNDRAALPVGTTGAQALATILGKDGEQTMLDVFDLAVTLKPGAPLSDVTVHRAKRELLPAPRKTADEPAPPPEPFATDDPDPDPEHDPYDPAELVGELQQTRLALEDLLAELVHTDPSDQDRAASLREISAIRQRLDQLATSLERTKQTSAGARL